MINSIKISFLIQSLKLILFSPFKKVVLIGTPEHGNLGDHAISIAERILLKKNRIRCVEISGYFYRRFPKLISQFIKKKDVIGIHGGGFLGSLWKEEDDMANQIIQTYPNNRIVIFPQTIFFTCDKDCQEFIKVYSSHKDLHLFLREENSYKLAVDILKNSNCKIYLVPDMALSLDTDYLNVPERGNKVLLCFRTDKEIILSQENRHTIKKLISNINCETEEITTCYPRCIVLANREKELNRLLTKIKTSKYLIADRLHAMIFAYITGTPCYVFDNISHKVSGVYKWIEDCDYIRFCEKTDMSEIDFSLKPGAKKNFDNEFQELVKVLQK